LVCKALGLLSEQNPADRTCLVFEGDRIQHRSLDVGSVTA